MSLDNLISAPFFVLSVATSDESRICDAVMLSRFLPLPDGIMFHRRRSVQLQP